MNTGRAGFLLTAAALAAGGVVTWLGEPDREVSLASAGELWADVLRDADQFGLQLSRVSDKDEIDLGKKLASGYAAGFTTDMSWQPYVASVGNQLVRSVSRKGIPYEFHVVDEPSVNAFALPGGQIFVFTGLLQRMQSEAELAAVLGHEIAHVDARHTIERFQYEIRLKKLGLGDLAGLTRLVQGIISQGYARYQETEADAIGMRLSMAAGYDPRGVENMFRALMAVEGQSGNATRAQTPLDEMVAMGANMVADYFRSHPPTPERLRRVHGLIEAERRGNPTRQYYVGGENFRRKVARAQQEFSGEWARW